MLGTCTAASRDWSSAVKHISVGNRFLVAVTVGSSQFNQLCQGPDRTCDYSNSNRRDCCFRVGNQDTWAVNKTIPVEKDTRPCNVALVSQCVLSQVYFDLANLVWSILYSIIVDYTIQVASFLL